MLYVLIHVIRDWQVQAEEEEIRKLTEVLSTIEM